MVKDYAYVAVFDRKELPSLKNMIKRINETHDTTIIEDFHKQCDKEVGKTVMKTDDLVVTVGLQQCINLILGTSSARWSHMATGAGSTVPIIGNTALTTEVGTRIDMSTSVGGWREANGMRLLFGGILGETAGGISTVSEIGVFNASSAGTMLNKNVYSASSQIALVRTLNNAVFILSTVIEFCPVT